MYLREHTKDIAAQTEHERSYSDRQNRQTTAYPASLGYVLGFYQLYLLIINHTQSLLNRLY